jgi:hypothetical protein
MQVHTPTSVLRNYFHAKDENRPAVLREVFTADATLAIANRSAAIDFPATTTGRDEIARVLVSDFARMYEDVYSYAMGRPAEGASPVSCDWLVVMTAKDDRSVRVGCGRYDWFFGPAGDGLATRLVITIEAMQVLRGADAPVVYHWAKNLEYPWSAPAAALAHAPDLPALAPVLRYLARGAG